jgi:hypothetical protein
VGCLGENSQHMYIVVCNIYVACISCWAMHADGFLLWTREALYLTFSGFCSRHDPYTTQAQMLES